MARRKDHTREELKALILQSAWQIVEEQGLPQLTARNIGKAIGYVPGTIYNVFPSMEILQLHLNGITLQRLSDHLEKSSKATQGKPLEKRLQTLAKAYLNFAMEFQPQWMTLFAQDLSEIKDREQWYKDLINNMFSPLELILTDAQKSPASVRRKDQIRKDSQILWSSVHGITYLWMTGKLPITDIESQQNKKKNSQDWEYMVSRLINTYIAHWQNEK